MISAILFCVLSAPCDGVQCHNAILPRHTITVEATAEVRRPVAKAARAVVTKTGKAVVRVAAAPVKAVGKLAAAVRNREHRPAKAVAAVGKGAVRLLGHLRPRARR